MPTYEYLCKACGHEFEREQRITAAPIKTCPKCKARKVERLISRTSFVLKGSGWYSDLYSSASGKKDKGADSGASDAGAADAGATGKDAKSDAKPEPAKDASKQASKGGSGGKKSRKASAA